MCGQRGGSGGFGVSDFQDGDGFVFFMRGLGEVCEGGGVVDAFNVEADCGDARVVQHCGADVGHSGLRLVADACDICERQRAALHCDVVCDVGRLRDDCEAGVGLFSAVLVGPQRDAVQVVEESVAVGSEDGHCSGGVDEFVLERAVVCFGESGGEEDGAAASDVGELFCDADGFIFVHPDERGVGRLCEVGDGGDAWDSVDGFALGVDGMERSGEFHFDAFPDDIPGPVPADGGDAFGPKQPREVADGGKNGGCLGRRHFGIITERGRAGKGGEGRGDVGKGGVGVSGVWILFGGCGRMPMFPPSAKPAGARRGMMFFSETKRRPEK